MIVQIALHVKGLRGYQQGQDFADALADHIMETFNDDGSVEPVMHFKLFQNDGVSQIKRGRRSHDT